MYSLSPQKVAKLKSSLHFLDAAPGNTHTVFVDTDAEALAFSGAEYLGTAPELVGRTFNRPRLDKLAEAPVQVGGQHLRGWCARSRVRVGCCCVSCCVCLCFAALGRCCCASPTSPWLRFGPCVRAHTRWGTGCTVRGPLCIVCPVLAHVCQGPADKKAVKKARKESAKAYEELSARIDRADKLRRARQHLEIRKALLVRGARAQRSGGVGVWGGGTTSTAVMTLRRVTGGPLQGKGARVKEKDATGDAPVVYKWKPIRKK